jgi:hypothetical protein
MKTAILALCASSASAFVNIPKLQSLKTVVRAEDDEAEAAPSPAPAPARPPASVATRQRPPEPPPPT